MSRDHVSGQPFDDRSSEPAQRMLGTVVGGMRGKRSGDLLPHWFGWKCALSVGRIANRRMDYVDAYFDCKRGCRLAVRQLLAPLPRLAHGPFGRRHWVG